MTYDQGFEDIDGHLGNLLGRCLSPEHGPQVIAKRPEFVGTAAMRVPIGSSHTDIDIYTLK